MPKSIRIFMFIIAALIILAVGISSYVTFSVSGRIAGTDDGSGIDQSVIDECTGMDPQCILVLGCSVWEDNQPSPMLRDRLDTAIELYKQGAAPKLLLSGDNSTPEYSEPDCMFEYVHSRGIPAEDIFLDFAGFSTYESVYRAHAVFKVDRMIVVTQKYHLYRALKAADALGMDAEGVASNQKKYTGRYIREAREVLARDKDLVKGWLKAKPTYLGDEIPIDGDGRVTQVNKGAENGNIDITFINDIEKADIWILPQTEENLKTSVWGKATIGGLEKGSETALTLNGPGDAEFYIVRIIADDYAYYSADNIYLEDGFTIHFTTDDRRYEATVDILDKNGETISSQDAFTGMFGSE